MTKAVEYAAEPVRRWVGKKETTVYHSEIVPYLAIGFFAGLRPDEIRRLRWQDIDFTAKEIHVNADTSKTSTERTVQVAPHKPARH